MKSNNIRETVSVNMSANGDSPDDIITMMNRIFTVGGQKPVTQDMMPKGGPIMPMVKTLDVVKNADVDEAPGDYEGTKGTVKRNGKDYMDPVTANNPHMQASEPAPDTKPVPTPPSRPAAPAMANPEMKLPSADSKDPIGDMIKSTDEEMNNMRKLAGLKHDAITDEIVGGPGTAPAAAPTATGAAIGMNEPNTDQNKTRSAAPGGSSPIPSGPSSAAPNAQAGQPPASNKLEPSTPTPKMPGTSGATMPGGNAMGTGFGLTGPTTTAGAVKPAAPGAAFKPTIGPGGKVSADQLNQFRQTNPGATLGQYMNAAQGKTAIAGGANDPNSKGFKGAATIGGVAPAVVPKSGTAATGGAAAAKPAAATGTAPKPATATGGAPAPKPAAAPGAKPVSQGGPIPTPTPRPAGLGGAAPAAGAPKAPGAIPTPPPRPAGLGSAASTGGATPNAAPKPSAAPAAGPQKVTSIEPTVTKNTPGQRDTAVAERYKTKLAEYETLLSEYNELKRIKDLARGIQQLDERGGFAPRMSAPRMSAPRMSAPMRAPSFGNRGFGNMPQRGPQRMPNLNPRGRFDRDGRRNRPYYQQQNGSNFMGSLIGGALNGLFNQGNRQQQGSYGYNDQGNRQQQGSYGYNDQDNNPTKGKPSNDTNDTGLNPANNPNKKLPQGVDDKSALDDYNNLSTAEKQAKIKAALPNGMSYDQYNQALNATEPDAVPAKKGDKLSPPTQPSNQAPGGASIPLTVDQINKSQAAGSDLTGSAERDGSGPVKAPSTPVNNLSPEQERLNKIAPPSTQFVKVNPSINAPKGDPDDDNRNKSLTRSADQGAPSTNKLVTPTQQGPETPAPTPKQGPFGSDYRQVPGVFKPAAPTAPAPPPTPKQGPGEDWPVGTKPQDKPGTTLSPPPAKPVQASAADGADKAVDEEFANEPNPRYKDVDYMNMMLAGGLNSPKKTYPKVAKGDNPMQQVSERVLRDLKLEFEKFKNEQLS